MKKLIFVLLVLLVLLVGSISCYAEVKDDEIITKNSVQVPVSYKVLSKQYKSTVEKRVRYVTDEWARVSTYLVAKGESMGYSISFSTTTEAIFKTAVKLCNQFTVSRTKTYTVSRYIDADKSKDSKLAFKADYKKYYVHMQKTSSLGITSDLGWSYVYEPTVDTYLRVVYK